MQEISFLTSLKFKTEINIRSASGKSVVIPKGTSIGDALEMIKGV